MRPVPRIPERQPLSLSIRIFQVVLATLCLFAFIQPTAHAQANAGITGTVTDASGAVVPNAKVTVTNQDTSVATHLITSGAGTYAVRGLNPGHYTVAVEATGFRKM